MKPTEGRVAIVGHRATHHASQNSALDVATRLARKFTGTAWTAVAMVDIEGA